MKYSIVLMAAAMSILGIAGAADTTAPAIVSISRLSMDMAIKLAKASIDACRKENVNVAVTVVDRGGHPQVVLRDTLAMDLALPVSKQKAYTALSFNTPTSQLEGRFPGNYSVPKLDSVIVAAGGLPITAGGSIVGGVGVSGAPSGVTDEKCAQAGIDAIKFDLETF